MPAIKPNLLLIDADVAAEERASAIMADYSSQLVIARDCTTAIQILSDHLIDLIILDRNIIARGQQLESVVARFHQLKGRHDVPVLITCGSRRTGVLFKMHPWGVAYHVPRAIAPTAMSGVIQVSLTLKVHYDSGKQSLPSTPKFVTKQLGSRLPEVIMPPHDSSTR